MCCAQDNITPFNFAQNTPRNTIITCVPVCSEESGPPHSAWCVRQMEEMDTSSSTLPAYFPRVAKECKGVAKEFFDCFSTESKYAPGMVGGRALVAAA